jgi:hypothetical protein
VQFVKGLLLQDNVKHLANQESENNQNAFASSRNYNGPRCYTCNQFGHIQKYCEYNGPSRSDKFNVKKKEKKNFAATSFAGTASSDDWFLDSGATTHSTSCGDLIHNYCVDTKSDVSVANGNVLHSAGKGAVEIPLSTNLVMDAKDVLHVPSLSLNLLLVASIAKYG